MSADVLQQNVSWYFSYSPVIVDQNKINDLAVLSQLVQFVSFRVAATLKALTALIHLDFTSDISISSSLDHPPKQRKRKMQLMIVAKKITQ